MARKTKEQAPKEAIPADDKANEPAKTVESENFDQYWSKR